MFVLMATGLAAGVQPVMQELVAETVTAVACEQQETAEMGEVFVQKVAVMQHSVGVYCVKVGLLYHKHLHLNCWH